MAGLCPAILHPGSRRGAGCDDREDRVRAAVDEPGLIDTPLTRHRLRYAQAADEFASDKSTSALEADAKTKLTAKSPFGIPWIEPEAIAPAVVCLASDEARLVSGATYDVTGGDSANYTAWQDHGSHCPPFCAGAFLETTAKRGREARSSRARSM